MTGSKEANLIPPKRGTSDVIHAIIRAGISAVPYVGGSGKELFALIVGPPLEKRREKWFDAVAIRLRQLESVVAGFSVEKLRDDPAFITIVLHATTIALKTHQEDILTALRNAVLNSALKIDIEEDLQLMFLSLIESLTTSHLKILAFLNEPYRYQFNVIKKSLPSVFDTYLELWEILELVIPELSMQRDLYGEILSDLYRHGLTRIDKTKMRGRGQVMKLGNADNLTSHVSMASYTTDLGKAFVNYITETHKQAEPNSENL